MAYKRRIYLINPKFQLKFSAYVCLLMFISSLIYPFTLYDVLTDVIQWMSTRAPSVSGSLKEKRTTLIVILAIWQLGYTALVFIICIFFSHKIAGPLYKLRKYFAMIKDGQHVGRLSFRKGDYFHEIADEFNGAMGNIQENYKKDFVYLSEVNAYLNNLSLVVPDDKKVVLNEINKKLTEIQDRFNDL